MRSKSDQAVDQANERTALLLKITPSILTTKDEKEVISATLDLVMEITGAIGASCVTLDPYGQPMGVLRQGQIPVPVPDAWLEYMASPEIQQQCQNCQNQHLFMSVCPMLNGPFSSAIGIYCLPFRRGEFDFGVLNIYLPDESRMLPETKEFLGKIVETVTAVLETIQMHRQELTALESLRTVRKKADLRVSLRELLTRVAENQQADHVMLFTRDLASVGQDVSDQDLSQALHYGAELEAAEGERIRSAIRQVLTSGEEIVYSVPTSQSDDAGSPFTVMGIPLSGDEKLTIGAMAVLWNPIGNIQQNQLDSLRRIAQQAAYVIQAAYRSADTEYRVVMDERLRLSREIHDGLAQTLGFLKLQVAQLQSYLERGEMEPLQKNIKLCYEALSDAYLDAREVIDGLRITVTGEGEDRCASLGGWLSQIVEEFQENSDSKTFQLTLGEIDTQLEIPLEIHAQLIRIVQEALSNIRKHANANQAWISCKDVAGDLILELNDNGQGFSAADILSPARHGLKGMRERAELIGADFQVISKPGQGTTIRIRLPAIGLQAKEN